MPYLGCVIFRLNKIGFFDFYFNKSEYDKNDWIVIRDKIYYKIIILFANKFVNITRIKGEGLILANWS